MHTLAVLVSLAAAAAAHPLLQASRSQHHAIAARHFKEPEGWFHDYLEPYDNYHIRYLAIKCHEKHDTAFFDLCCHPMLATETLEKNRAPECRPSADASASASAEAPTSTIDDSDGFEETDCEEEVDDEDDVPEPPVAAAPTPEPEPEQQEDAEDEPTSESPAPSPSPAPAPEPEHDDNDNDHDSDNGGSGGQTFTGGQVTYYYQNGVAGACGVVHSDDDLIAAMNTAQYYSLDICNKRVKITSDEGKTVIVKVVDQCPGCETNSIDLSRAAFEKLGALEKGIIKISWELLD